MLSYCPQTSESNRLSENWEEQQFFLKLFEGDLIIPLRDKLLKDNNKISNANSTFKNYVVLLFLRFHNTFS